MNCPNCRTANPEGARFCLNCATPLKVPPTVAGERKFVTVLFAERRCSDKPTGAQRSAPEHQQR
jgi:Double zinc ribbon